jgi:sulfite exporter TauE/SafE
MWATALIMGLAGSLHCVGMCSPLVAAATFQKPFLPSKLLYNGGRLAMYGLMGAGAAGVGTLLDLRPLQNHLSAALGLLLVLVALLGMARVRLPWAGALANRFVVMLKQLFGRALKQKTPLFLFVTGALNGLLPCGLTYLALLFCFTLPSPLEGFGYMVIFGAGTLPAMLGVGWLWGWLAGRFPVSLQTITLVSLLALGVLLMARGGWVSPVLGLANPEVVCP